jgi:hypothetical protein
MITPEEKARIARENGAKSRGPKTQEGKDRSRLNSMKHGEYSSALRFILPPHCVITCLEDREKFFALFEDLVNEYKPVGNAELRIVRDMAVARWKIDRAEAMETALLNREITRRTPEFDPDSGANPDFFAVELMLAVDEQLAGSKLLREYRRTVRENARAFRQHVRFLVQQRRDFPPAGHQPATADPYRETDLVEMDVEAELEAELAEQQAADEAAAVESAGNEPAFEGQDDGAGAPAEDAAATENEQNEESNQPDRTDRGYTQREENKGQIDPWAKLRSR